MKTIYISIGNSDDKLTQARWALFFRDTNRLLRSYAQSVRGQWVSEPASAWQNACWCVEIREVDRKYLMQALGEQCVEFGQDSIAWAEAQTTFILPPPAFYGTVTTGEVDSGESRTAG